MTSKKDKPTDAGNPIAQPASDESPSCPTCGSKLVRIDGGGVAFCCLCFAPFNYL